MGPLEIPVTTMEIVFVKINLLGRHVTNVLMGTIMKFQIVKVCVTFQRKANAHYMYFAIFEGTYNVIITLRTFVL